VHVLASSQLLQVFTDDTITLSMLITPGIHWRYYYTVHAHYSRYSLTILLHCPCSIPQVFTDDTITLSMLNTPGIHWRYYYTVHAHVVIYFCDSMWYFLMNTNLWVIQALLFIFSVYICIVVGDPNIKREGLGAINRLISPSHFLCACSMSGHGFTTPHVVAIFRYSFC
jgi:hypothetical protein